MRSNAYCGNLLWQSSLTLPALSNGDVLKRIDPQREKGVDDLKGGELALPNGEYAISPRVVDLKIASEE